MHSLHFQLRVFPMPNIFPKWFTTVMSKDVFYLLAIRGKPPHCSLTTGFTCNLPITFHKQYHFGHGSLYMCFSLFTTIVLYGIVFCGLTSCTYKHYQLECQETQHIHVTHRVVYVSLQKISWFEIRDWIPHFVVHSIMKEGPCIWNFRNVQSTFQKIFKWLS